MCKERVGCEENSGVIIKRRNFAEEWKREFNIPYRTSSSVGYTEYPVAHPAPDKRFWDLSGSVNVKPQLVVQLVFPAMI